MNGPPEKHSLRLSSTIWRWKEIAGISNMGEYPAVGLFSGCSSDPLISKHTGGFRVVPDFFTKEDSGRHSGKLPIRRIPIPCKIGWFLFPCFDGRPGRPWWFSQTDRSSSHGIRTPRSVTSSWTRPIGVLPSAALQGSSIPTSRDWTVPRKPPGDLGDLGWFKLELFGGNTTGHCWHHLAYQSNVGLVFFRWSYWMAGSDSTFEVATNQNSLL